MAKPGADWRELTDGYRTDTPENACGDCSAIHRKPAAPNCGNETTGVSTAKISIENPGNGGTGDEQPTVGTNDHTSVGSFAIGDLTRRVGVTERSGPGTLDGRPGGPAPGRVSTETGSVSTMHYFRSDPGRHRAVIAG